MGAKRLGNLLILKYGWKMSIKPTLQKCFAQSFNILGFVFLFVIFVSNINSIK